MKVQDMKNESKLEKIKRCFHSSEDNVIYQRSEEIKKIQEFLASKDLIVHITGNPGTGKTSIVKSLLKDFDHIYVNYFKESAIKSILGRSTAKVVVIDEFDKYFSENKKECIAEIVKLNRRGVKLITISNNLKMGSIKFKPYSSEEIVSILKEKISREIGEDVIEDSALKFIGKKFDRCGDMRLVLKYINTIYTQKSDDYVIRLGDLLPKEQVNEAKSIHHEIICKILKEIDREDEVFTKYIKECQAMSIQSFNRNDFDIIYNLYS